MALAIEELVRKATTATTDLQNLIPQKWNPRLEKNLRKHGALMETLVVDNTLLGASGDTVYIPLLPDLGAAIALTEGTDMVDVKLTGSTVVPIVPSEIGVSVGITRKALDRLNYNGVAEIVDRMGYSMSLKMNTDVAALWNATVPGAGNGQSMAVQYPNGHTSATLVAGDVMSDLVLLTAIATLEQNNVELWDDGYYRLFITPQQFKQLIQDTNIRQDLRYASPQRLITGEKGALHGCRIIVNNYVPCTGNTTNAVAAENGTNVAKALLLTPRWAFIAYKRKPEIVVDPTVYDMGRRRRFGATADYQAVLVHAERGLVISTANV